MKDMDGVIYVFLVLGVILLIFAIFNLHKYKFWKKQVMVTGEIMDVSRTYGRGGANYHLRYTYTDLKGITHTAFEPASGCKASAYKKGCRIKIYYDAKNMGHSILFDQTEKLLSDAKMFFVFMILCLFIVVKKAFV